MKKLLLVLIVAVLFVSLSCSKSSTTPATVYTIKYTISVTDTVSVDTVQYKDMSGEVITKYNLNSLDYSFTSEKNYDASLFLTGRIMNGAVQASLEISDATGVIYFDSKGDSWQTPQFPMKFTYTMSKKYFESK